MGTVLFDSGSSSPGASFGLSISDPYNAGPHQKDGSFFVNNISNINLNGNKTLPQSLVNAMRLFWNDKKRLLFTTRLPLMQQVCQLCQFKTHSGSSKMMTYSETPPRPLLPPFANVYPDWPALHKWSSRLAGLFQMIYQIGRPFPNDHPDGPAFCKWSSEWAVLLQMIIQMGRPFANDHTDFFLSTRFFSICILIFS